MNTKSKKGPVRNNKPKSRADMKLIAISGAVVLVLAVVAYLLLINDGRETPSDVSTGEQAPPAQEEQPFQDMAQSAPPSGPMWLENAPSPDFSLTEPDGTVFTLSENRGKVLMINFWATWCPPCKREIPDFIELQKKYGSKGLNIVGIALDKPEAVMEFLRDNPLNYTVLFGNDDVSGAFGKIESIPTTFLLDRDGIVRSVKIGLESKAEWDRLIREYL